VPEAWGNSIKSEEVVYPDEQLTGVGFGWGEKGDSPRNARERN